MSILASRVIVGGDPARWSEYAPTSADKDSARRERIHELANPEAGIVGWGTCGETATRRICEHSAKCLGDAIALRPLTCYKRDATVTRQEHRAERTAVTDVQVRDILAHMRKHTEPVTFRDVCIALGYAETPLLLSGAWKRLLNSGVIVAVGERVTRGNKHTHHVKAWIIAEEEL